MSEVRADLQTTVQVSGTLYPSNVTPNKLDANPKIIQSINNEIKFSGVIGDLGDSSSDLVSLLGIMLVLSGVGLIIERLI